jgi:diacylglycerol kinase (ATP)
MVNSRTTSIKVIVNPASGNGRTGKTWATHEPYLVKMLGEVDVSFTRAVKDASLMAHQALQNGYTHIIAVGGDGTLSEVINGFFINDHPVNAEAVLSFIPSGTGSDIARTLELPADKYLAIKRIADRKNAGIKQMLDVGKMTYKRFDNNDATSYFCNVVSFGMGGNVVQHVNRTTWLKRFGGKFTFLSASLLTLLSYTNKIVRLRVYDEHQVSTFDARIQARLVAVANGRFFGGSMMIAPEAVPNDGIFDIVTVENLSRLQAARKLPLIYSGAHIGDPDVRVCRGTLIIAESDEEVLIDADGEGPGKLPLTVQLLPQILAFV